TIAAAGNVDNGIVALPSAIPATFSGAFNLTQSGVGATYTSINVFPGAGTAAGNELTISAAMGNGNGATPVTKIGGGTVTFSGTTANAYTGQTTVDEGTLILAKGASVNAMTGTLVVGDFSGSAVAKVTSAFNNFNTAEPVIANSSGTFDISSTTV